MHYDKLNGIYQPIRKEYDNLSNVWSLDKNNFDNSYNVWTRTHKNADCSAYQTGRIKSPAWLDGSGQISPTGGLTLNAMLNQDSPSSNSHDCSAFITLSFDIPIAYTAGQTLLYCPAASLDYYHRLRSWSFGISWDGGGIDLTSKMTDTDDPYYQVLNIIPTTSGTTKTISFNAYARAPSGETDGWYSVHINIAAGNLYIGGMQINNVDPIVWAYNDQ